MTNPNDPIGVNPRTSLIPRDMPTEWADKVKELTLSAQGLTKREYFAAMADANWNSVMAALGLKGNKKPSLGEMLKARAQIKVMEADALIAELNKEPSK